MRCYRYLPAELDECCIDSVILDLLHPVRMLGSRVLVEQVHDCHGNPIQDFDAFVKVAVHNSNLSQNLLLDIIKLTQIIQLRSLGSNHSLNFTKFVQHVVIALSKIDMAVGCRLTIIALSCAPSTGVA